MRRLERTEDRRTRAPERGGGGGGGGAKPDAGGRPGRPGRPGRHVGADERIDHAHGVVEINKRTGTAGIGVARKDPGDSATAGTRDAGIGTAGQAGPGKPLKEQDDPAAAERAGGGPTSAGSAPARD